MILSKTYIKKLMLGWTLAGVSSFLLAFNYIGGAATLLLLTAFACWTVLPALHLATAATVAKKAKRDPSPVVSLIIVSIAVLILILLVASGIFHYV